MDNQMAYDRLRQFLDSKNWRYDVEESELKVFINFTTDDIALKHVISVRERVPLISLLSLFPFTFPEERLNEGMIACNLINYRLFDGCFSIDVNKGGLYFLTTVSYGHNGSVDYDVLDFLISFANEIVDEYNDILFDLAKGKIDLKKFNELISAD